jgi:RIO-like serine/threonine protein kinase
VDDSATKHLHDAADIVAAAPFGREALEQGCARVLSRGRWANAVLYLVEHKGQAWVVKDFAPRAFFVRQSTGRLLISRELSALQRVQGIAGVPQEAFRVDAYALGYRYVSGQTLNHAQLGPRCAEFFTALEHLLRQVHAVGGIVHLDVRTSRNVLVTEHDEPVLIDFQSHLSTRWMPARIREWIERFDMAGVYKHWARRSPETMGDSREIQLREMNRWRRPRFLRGYLGVRKSRPTR